MSNLQRAFLTYGDHKSSYQALDHQGWIKLDGRLKSTLTATQQAQATALGMGVNLPNEADVSIVGASGTKALGTTGGAASVTIAQTNLPNVNFVGGNHAHTASDSGHAHGVGIGYQNQLAAGGTGSTGSGFSSNSGTGGGTNNYSTSAAAASITVNASGALSIPSGGSNVPLPIQNPYLALNGFVYLGA